jgi:ribose-phosphate pyrophosphokinase
MNPVVISGTANLPLAESVAGLLGVKLCAREVERFPDGEIHVEIGESIRGEDIYLIQPTSPPVESNLLELLLLADACRRAGAGRLTAIIPYFGYARQDRRSSGREAVGARLVADLITASGVQQVVAIDLHTAAIEGFFTPPLDHLSAVPTLVEAIRSRVPSAGVIVAPDLGAVKLAERYAAPLGLPVAIIHKTRTSGTEVQAQRVIGDVQGRAPVIVDDMISTGGTIAAAAESLIAAGCVPDMLVVASHGLFVGTAAAQLASLPIRHYVVTDSVQHPASPPAPLERVSLGPLIAEAIRCLHEERSLRHLRARI